ncbi:uncharacterized protein LOC118644634 [Monomorium pharaonis]|uniref:uncharacterized protein LOC118644634 n=1 Tax=Monomorium pharaonis TaxID=307658 RepID=UPI001745E2E0|nr:uncharacterized protein LOC118644634 [Monomorium pharaonis]
METYLSASVGPILPAATLISGLLSWFSPLFFAEASPDPPPPLFPPTAPSPRYTLPLAPRLSRRRVPFRAASERERNGERRKGEKERERERERKERDDAAFRRIVLLKESDAKALSRLLSSFLSLYLVSLYFILYSRSLSLFLSSSLFQRTVTFPPSFRSLFRLRALSVAHWKIYAVNYRDPATRPLRVETRTRREFSPKPFRFFVLLFGVPRPSFRFSVRQVPWKNVGSLQGGTFHVSLEREERNGRDCSFYRGYLEPRADVAKNVPRFLENCPSREQRQNALLATNDCFNTDPYADAIVCVT